MRVKGNEVLIWEKGNEALILDALTGEKRGVSELYTWDGGPVTVEFLREQAV